MRRVAIALSSAALLAGGLLTVGTASAQDPCDLNPALPICTPDEEPTDEPTPEPSPQPSPQPSPTSQPSPEPEPSVAPSDEPSPTDTFTPFEGSVDAPAFETGGSPTTGGSSDGQAPQVFQPGQGQGTGGAVTGPMVLVGVDDLAAALPGVMGMGLLTALLGVATVLGTRGLLRRGGLVAHTPDGGIDVERTRRTRSLLGVALLGAAAVVGVIGYMKISLEPIVAVQVVYLASAGFAVVVLAIAGGSLVVSDQLRADEHRIAQLEQALSSVAEHVRPQVQEPPRLLDRSGADDTQVIEEPSPKPARKRTAKKAASKGS